MWGNCDACNLTIGLIFLNSFRIKIIFLIVFSNFDSKSLFDNPEICVIGFGASKTIISLEGFFTNLEFPDKTAKCKGV